MAFSIRLMSPINSLMTNYTVFRHIGDDMINKCHAEEFMEQHKTYHEGTESGKGQGCVIFFAHQSGLDISSR